LAVIAAIPTWLTILIVSRDVLIVGAVVLSWVLGEPSSVQPLRLSKVNTVLQILLAAFVLGDLAFPIDLAYVTWTLVYLVAILTVASGGVYLVEWVRHMGSGPAAASGPMPAAQHRGRDEGQGS
jgi:cardiolipin synthase